MTWWLYLIRHQVENKTGTYTAPVDGFISAVARNGSTAGTVQEFLSFNGKYTISFHLIPNAGATATVSSGFIRIKKDDVIQYSLIGTGRKWLIFLRTR